MESYEHNTRVFIVKVWVEDNDDDTCPVHWRGHITQVMSRERQYFEELAAVVRFITPYLEEMGVSINKPEHGLGNAD